MSEKLEELKNITGKIHRERFPEANSILLAGSYVRDQATKYSDIDLVVLYDKLEFAYRDAFFYEKIPVEVYVHDFETLKYFFEKMDKPSGHPSLPQMVKEGISTVETELVQKAKSLAGEFIEAGPDPLTERQLSSLRYQITDLIDDMREARDLSECRASATRLYEPLADLFLRGQGFWSAAGKWIPRRLKEVDEKIADEFDAAFEDAFVLGEVDPLIALCEKVLEPYGGFHFEGYRMDAPPEWRIK